MIQESNGLTGDVGVNVVVEKAYALGQHSSSPVLNRPSEFFECLTIPVSVYCGPMSHEVRISPSVVWAVGSRSDEILWGCVSERATQYTAT